MTPVLTRDGAEFVTPLSVGALAKAKVHEALFDLTSEAEMGHIELSRSADLLVVAPATADLCAKMAGGRADDLASTVLLATDKHVLVAPAMNVRMWQHPATQRNLRHCGPMGCFSSARMTARWPAASMVPVGWPSLRPSSVRSRRPWVAGLWRANMSW